MREPRIACTVAMPRPHSHLLEVEVEVEGLLGGMIDFVLPSWTPGSYMIREYARHVQEFGAQADGGPAAWQKVAKDTWRVETGGASRAQVHYKVYAHDLTVRTCHLDASHGFVNGAAVFMFVAGRTAESIYLAVHTPRGWKVTTGLEPAGARSAEGARGADGLEVHRFAAFDYDELVDCPLECGTHREVGFEVDGIPHRIAVWGTGNEDLGRLREDFAKIVETQRNFFGGLPYRHYTFILHLDGGRGGLEHRNSTVLLTDRWSFAPRSSYERFLVLASHEFFHVWNVKRIRPEALGPFDYRRENYTRQLWEMEGVTSYYDKRLLARAGLIAPERYLELLAEDVLSLESQPGRTLQSLEQSSVDAWIKHYRPDENTANSSVSYYLKGSLVAWMLDLEIRARTEGRRSLDDVLRHLQAAYPVQGPGIPEEGGYLAAVEKVAGDAGGAYRDFFARYVSGTEALDLVGPLSRLGLRLEWGHKTSGNGPVPSWLGAQLRDDGGRLVVSSVRSDGPAYTAGLYPGDELVALNGFRIDEVRLAERRPGETVRLALFRRAELLEVQATLAAAPPDTLKILHAEGRTADQQRLYEDWLGLSPPASPLPEEPPPAI